MGKEDLYKRRELPPVLEAKAQQIRETFQGSIDEDSQLKQLFDEFVISTKQFPLLPAVNFSAYYVINRLKKIETEDRDSQFMLTSIRNKMMSIVMAHERYNNLDDKEGFIAENLKESDIYSPKAETEMRSYYEETFDEDTEKLAADCTGLHFFDSKIRGAHFHDSNFRSYGSARGVLGIELSKEFYSDIYTRVINFDAVTFTDSDFDALFTGEQ